MNSIIELISIFSNRELAFFFWLAIFLIWFNTRKELLSGMKGILAILVKPKMLRVFFLLIVYFILSVLLLTYFLPWSGVMLKDSILWFFAGGLVAVYNLTSLKTQTQFFNKTIRDNIKVVILFEFVVAFHSFHLLIEIVLLPLIFIIVGINEISKLRKEHQKLVNPSGWILSVIGIGLFSHSIYYIYQNTASFFTWSTFTSFILPILLTAIFMPCLYFLAVYMKYDEIFARLKFTLDGNEKIRFALWQVLKKAHFSLNRLEVLGTQTGKLPRHATLTEIKEAMSFQNASISD